MGGSAGSCFQRIRLWLVVSVFDIAREEEVTPEKNGRLESKKKNVPTKSIL